MSAAAALLPETLPVADDGAGRPAVERQLAKLDRLADLGLEIAEALAAQARGTGPQVIEGDVALAYDRVARAVRMAVMLQSRLIEEARLSRDGAAGPASGAAVDPAGQARARKDGVVRIVKRVAQAHGGLDGFQVGWLAGEARERLEHDDIYGQVMSRPVSDLVADICDDLGLTPDWAHLAAEAWAQAEIESGVVGEPLLEFLDAPAPAERGGGDAPNPVPAAPTLHEHLQALARDPEVLATARRGSVGAGRRASAGDSS